MPEVRWEFCPVALQYINSTAQIAVLAGPPGTAKTFSSISGILAHQQRANANIRIAVIRDTLENIRISLIPSFYEFFAAAPGAFVAKNENKVGRIDVAGGFHIDMDLFGCDDPEDLQKLQGASSWDMIWINDPIPMDEKSNAGVPEIVYNHAAYRSQRKSGVAGRLQIDMNYAGETHWGHRRLIEAPDINPENLARHQADPSIPLIRKEVFYVTYNMMAHRNRDAEEMAKISFTDEASQARYVEGRPAEYHPGKKVTPGYRRGIHRCPYNITPGIGLTGFAFCDGWHHPSVVLGQITKNNRLIFIDTVYEEGIDILTLLNTRVRPLLASPKWQNKCSSFRIGGDPSMAQPDQNNPKHCVANDVVNFFHKLFPGRHLPEFEKGPVLWHIREHTIGYWLNQDDEAHQPMIYLSHDNLLLDKGLNGAWHYPTDKSGNVKDDAKPDKGPISNPCDAWCYAVCKLLGEEPLKINQGQVNKMRKRTRDRAKSYNTSRGTYA